MQRDALKLTWENHDLPNTAGVLDAVAETAVWLGDYELARDLLQASEHLRLVSGVKRLPYYTRQLTNLLGDFHRDGASDISALESTIERVIHRGLRR